MTKVISFEKFVALNQAGINAAQARTLDTSPQMHSTGEDLAQALTRRASGGAPRGY